MATVDRTCCREVSALTIERYVHNVLEPQRKAEVEAHMAGCRDCAARLQEAQALGEKFAYEVLPRTLPAPLRMVPDVALPQASPSWFSWPRLAMGFGCAAACAIAVVAVVGLAERGNPPGTARTDHAAGAPPGMARTDHAAGAPHPRVGQDNSAGELRSDPQAGPPAPNPQVNAKGSDGWRVYCRRGSDVFLVQPGQELEAGDSLRFVPDVRGPANIMVVSVEAGGRFNVYYPIDNDRSVALTTGPGIPLPGSVVMDSSVGEETLYLLASDSPFDLHIARSRVKALKAQGGASQYPSDLSSPTPDFHVFSLPVQKVAP